MFERLVSKVLSGLLAKYFTEECLERNKVSTSAQLGVWSGYIVLKDLELKNDVINTRIRRKGLPFEIVHCTFRSVEITIPWSKLSNPIGARASSSDEDSVVVVVLDGVHVLARTSFVFNDLALREDSIKKRRRSLLEAGDFSKDETNRMTYTEMFKKRVTDGLLQEIMDKLHLHIRDLHIRLEDVECDPGNPFACGITLESMHVQHDAEESNGAGFISKVAKINHFAVYWNALDFSETESPENSLLHMTCQEDRKKITKFLDACISRRAKRLQIPKHTYILLPIDGALHGSLSMNPNNLRSAPAFEAVATIDNVSTQLRDFQIVQILSLVSEIKNHNFVKKYRRFRPLTSVRENPRAWWLYASRVIRYQLRESFLRWSWSQFEQAYSSRARYMQLYERKLRFPSKKQDDTIAEMTGAVDQSSILNRSRRPSLVSLNGSGHINDSSYEVVSATPDEGAGPSIPPQKPYGKEPLNQDEIIELQNLEDGIVGDLSVNDILLFRGLVNIRLGRSPDDEQQDIDQAAGTRIKSSSWWTRTVEKVADEDKEAKAEFERLLLHIEEASNESLTLDTSNKSQIAVSLALRLEELHVALFSPHHLTSGETQLRRIHEKFFDLDVFDIRVCYSLKGDYKCSDFQLSIYDIIGTETRRDRSQHVIAKQMTKHDEPVGMSTDPDEVQESEPFLAVTLSNNPTADTTCEKELVVFLNTLEISLSPRCQFITNTKEILSVISKVPSVADYWGNLSMAYVNSIALGRLGLLAKAESAAYEHKNMDVEITIQCPVLRISDGNGREIIADLGIAQFKTEKLAGISRSKLSQIPIVDSDETGNETLARWPEMSEELSMIGSIAVPASSSRSFAGSYKRRSERISSAFSVDQGTIMSGSGYYDEMKNIQSRDSTSGKHSNDPGNYKALFYDVYKLQLQTGMISVVDDKSNLCLTTGFQVSTTFKKSVIPSDHTLCKLKAHTDVNNLDFSLNDRAIIQILGTIKDWKALLGKIPETAAIVPKINPSISSRRSLTLDRMLSISSERSATLTENDRSEQGSASQVDENEFFDANDGEDSFHAENSGMWFEDNWINDAESVMDSDSRASSNYRRRRRRQPSVISDVSSASSLSLKGRRGNQGAYLSAENLARLEENASEDESIDMGVDSDDGSFHSVLSPDGQAELLNELEKDITDTEEQIQQMSQVLYNLQRIRVDNVEMDSVQVEKRSKERREVKLKLKRAESELKALQALQMDLSSLVAGKPQGGLSPLYEGASEQQRESRLSRARIEQAKEAKALLEAKRRHRDSMADQNAAHNMTKDLNRELFQGSIFCSEIKISIIFDDYDSDATKSPTVFDFVASKFGSAFFHFAHDKKLYFSMDQVSANLRDNENSNSSTCLFSGGSSDTLLPTHLPHLISHSMEERFLRGALYLGKRGHRDAPEHTTKMMKLRMVVGDVEICPRERCLTPVLLFCRRIRTSISSSTSPSAVQGDRATTRMNGVETTRSIMLSAPETLRQQAITTGPTSESATEAPARFVDLAIRFASTRVVLSCANQIVGGAAITEASIRHVQLISSSKNRLQVDVRCTNLQLIEVENLEAGRGREILGRRDPYNSIIQMRLRSQIVPSYESGGWVVGLPSTFSEKETISQEAAAQNAHLGLKMNPLTLVMSSDGLSRIFASIVELKALKNQGRSSMPESPQPANPSAPKPSMLARLFAAENLRWRADVSLRRISIGFPDGKGDDWNVGEDINNKVMFAFTFAGCVQQSSIRQDCLSLQMAATDISLIRSSDEWAILEPFSIAAHLSLEHIMFSKEPTFRRRLKATQLKMTNESPLNEIASALRRCGCSAFQTELSGGDGLMLRAKITPMKGNYSAPIIGLLIETMQSLKLLLKSGTNKRSDSANRPIKYQIVDTRRSYDLEVTIDSMEHEIYKESDSLSRSMASAEPLLSLILTGVVVGYEDDDWRMASIRIRTFSLFDLSSARGVRVLGEDPGRICTETPDFVNLRLHMNERSSTPKTTTLEINWGHVQCVLLPTFFRSILSLKNDIKTITKSTGKRTSEESSGNVLTRFVRQSSDLNLIIAADAESFECILSSKDLDQYIRTGGQDPIGVVSFRWTASLNVAVALDSLSGSSKPWETLNVNESFTDATDASLFKDFADRYFSLNSGFFAGSDEIGRRLKNAFTGKIALGVAGFQVLRTNIESSQLKAPSKTSGLPYKSANRIFFRTRPPAAGEQRITNQFDFNLVYRAAGATMSRIPENELIPPRVEMSQVLQIKANYVDVLLYISRGHEGVTECFRVTVKPILDMLKNKEKRRRTEDDEGSNTDTSVEKIRRRVPTIGSLLKSAPTMCTVQLEGFQITCVPGGATRLNESPIIKFELANFSSGFAGTLVPKDVKLIPGNSGSQKLIAQDLLSGVDVMHLTFAGWLVCNITAHYHNRRLVAWEPFIEPWIADVSFGIDLVEALKLQPSIKAELGELQSLDGSSSSLDPFGTSVNNGVSGDRFRDFGRLFRAPFQTSSSSKRVQDGSITHTDLSYLMMASTARSTILSVLGPASDSRFDNEARLFTYLPGRRPMEWLYSFGRSGFLQKDRRESSDQYSVSVLLSDAKPLNINLTGALIENVLGYLENVKREKFKPVAPHWIKNDTGMTIRFQEVLDADRVRKGEQSGSTILENGAEVPLTLVRSLSQSCDPHRAYIYLELGNFEDTVDRIRHDDYDIPKGSRSSFFFFKAAAKVPVDTVGVHRFPLDRNAELRPEAKNHGADSRALGWIIVRVELRGGTKVVSVESPFVLKSTVDADLLCEVRDHDGLSLLWRCLVPKSDFRRDSKQTPEVVSVPADIVPFIHDSSYRFSLTAISRGSSLAHEADFVNSNKKQIIEISTPPPFSPESFVKGLIGEQEIALPVAETGESELSKNVQVDKEMVHLSVCAVRIGSWSGMKAALDIPEQRMIFFRAPFIIRNCLALPIAVQVRVKRMSQTSVSVGPPKGTSISHEQPLGRRNTFSGDWEDLGVLDCGESVNWTGALSTDAVQLRTKFVGTDGDNSRRFPGWSTFMTIPPKEKGQRNDIENLAETPLKMKVTDADNVPLYLSVALEGGAHTNDLDAAVDENIRIYSRQFPSATRTVSIFVPYWIIDSTNQDLEFFSGAPVAGQLDRSVFVDNQMNGEKTRMTTSGLAELLDNDNFLSLPSTSSFDVMMIGDEKSSRLTVRKRLARKTRRGMRMSSPWSDPIPLQSGQNSVHDISVLSRKVASIAMSTDNDDGHSFDRLVLRSRVVTAPEPFGGLLGTKLIQVVNCYSVLNETGREIEIIEDSGSGAVTVIKASGQPQPFHFDDSKSIRFRFKEFGWTWSGHFKVRLNRREVTMRLRHKMKGHTVIVTMEVRSSKKSSTNVLIFRQSSHPPFRLENHTMHPLHYGQSSSRIGMEESDADAMLLPYQSADFAWDEPESRRRSLVVKSTGLNGSPDDFTLGRFQLDRLAPGTILSIESFVFAGEIVADGPTRVLRISDASMPRVSSFRQEDMEGFQQKQEITRTLKSSFLVKLSHGIGISVVDWSPQELLYVRLEDIQIERQLDSKTDTVTASIGNIKWNNQLWVTPYPVLLKMGRRSESLRTRKRNRRLDAISIFWRIPLNTHGGYGNLTLLERVEISSEPIFVNVDGKLAGLLLRMIRRAKNIGSHGTDDEVPSSRDEELRKLLDLGRESEPDATSSPKQPSGNLASDVDGEHPATAAIAAKLKTQPIAMSRPFYRDDHIGDNIKKGKNEMLTKPQHKYYIENLRISATRADLSWSGPLPGVVSNLILRALTFERLPIRLRPYSSSHSYGNTQDHLQSLKSHYVSFWRIVDLLMGIAYNPTFLFRAVVYTFRESFASALDSWSNKSKKTAKTLSKLITNESEFQPIYDDGLPEKMIMPKSTVVKQAVLGPLVRGAILAFTGSSDVADWMSSLIRYDAQSGAHQETRGLVRSRNPRLFAHMDGMDLLVEYVEGENAGKALLSRVRMGTHLGEGYIFHTEEARQLKAKANSPTDVDPAPCIIMITSERVLLLDGRLDRKFCSVIWESKFVDIVNLEILPYDESSPSLAYDQIAIWYLVDALFNKNVSEDRNTKPKSIVSGINILHKKVLMVPRHSGSLLLAKMRRLDRHLRRGFSGGIP